MPMAVRRDLMTCIGDLPNELGHLFGNPAQDEKRAVRSVPLENVEKMGQRSIEASRPHLPRVSRYDAVERVGVKILLDVNREEMDDVSRGSHVESDWPSGLMNMATRMEMNGARL